MKNSDTDTDSHASLASSDTPKVSNDSKEPPTKRSYRDVEPDSPVSNISLLRDMMYEILEPVTMELKSIKVQIRDLSEIKDFMSVTSQKLDMFAKLQDQLVSLGNRNSMLEEKVVELEEKVDKMSRNSSGESVVSELLLENRTLREKLLKNESHSRRDNLVFIGVAEQKGESCDAIILDILNSAGYDLDLRAVARAHRVGPYNKHRIRPIVEKFHHYRDRESVWEGRRYVKESCGVTIAEDFPEEIRERRKRLYPILNAAISYRDEDHPDFRFRARLSVDKLIINGSSYTVDTLCKLPERLRPDKTSSPVKDNAQVFFTSASPLSNHYA